MAEYKNGLKKIYIKTIAANKNIAAKNTIDFDK